MQRSASLLGLIGITFLLFAGVAYFITRTFSFYVLFHGLAGTLALIFALASRQTSIMAFLGERSTKYGVNAAFYSLIFLGILVLVNYLSTRYHHRFDTTRAGVYSLSPQSIDILKKLDKDLEVKAFVEGGTDPEIKELLDTYGYASSKVKPGLIDPDKQPDLAQRYGITSYRTIHLQYDDRSVTINKISEEDLTNGIIKITRQEKKAIYFIEGHGEPDITDLQESGGYGQVKTSLDNEGYEVKKFQLVSPEEEVPEDCDLLVVAGPQRSLLAHEVGAVDQYLKKGGHVLFLLNPGTAPELTALLQNWGTKVGDDVIVDQRLELFKGRTLDLRPIASSYGAHPITEDLTRRGTAFTIYSLSRSVEANEAGKSGLQVTSLVKTSPDSWAETDLDAIFQRRVAQLDPDKDKKGPVSLAVAVTARLKDMGMDHAGEARLVIFGNAVFANNQYLGQYFNRDLFLNTVGWLAGEEELVSIRPRALTASRAQFSAEEGTVIFYLSVLILPEFLLVAGLAVWWQRR
jgi:ABC-type uncharacterized transport system involved in gliding motility auxiliary subunit